MQLQIGHEIGRQLSKLTASFPGCFVFLLPLVFLGQINYNVLVKIAGKRHGWFTSVGISVSLVRLLCQNLLHIWAMVSDRK